MNVTCGMRALSRVHAGSSVTTSQSEFTQAAQWQRHNLRQNRKKFHRPSSKFVGKDRFFGKSRLNFVWTIKLCVFLRFQKRWLWQGKKIIPKEKFLIADILLHHTPLTLDLPPWPSIQIETDSYGAWLKSGLYQYNIHTSEIFYLNLICKAVSVLHSHICQGVTYSLTYFV